MINSYPVKLYEAMQCQVPVVSSDTEAARWIMGNDERFLAGTGDLGDLSAKVIDCLDLGRQLYRTKSSWDAAADMLEKVLL